MPCVWFLNAGFNSSRPLESCCFTEKSVSTQQKDSKNNEAGPPTQAVLVLNTACMKHDLDKCLLSRTDGWVDGWMCRRPSANKNREIERLDYSCGRGLIQYIQGPGFNPPSQKQGKGVCRKLSPLSKINARRKCHLYTILMIFTLAFELKPEYQS